MYVTQVINYCIEPLGCIDMSDAHTQIYKSKGGPHSDPFFCELTYCKRIVYLCAIHRQPGSLAGAAHLLNNNAGVIKLAQREQKYHVDQRGQCLLDFDVQYGCKL